MMQGNTVTNSDQALTSTEERKPQRQRHPLRFRRITVLRRESLTPSLLRLTFGGDDLEGFFSPGFDDHAKLIFPDPETGVLPTPVIGEDGISWPDGKRPLARDYTPRRFDAAAHTLDIDFALHEHGVATTWARNAQPGDTIGVAGPRGSFIVPTSFDWHLLVGDETAIPAISRRLEELPAGAKVVAVIEVDAPEHKLALPTAASAEIHWAFRQGTPAEQSDALLRTLASITFPEGDYYAWVASESAVAKAVRQYLLDQRNAQANWVRASGYWKPGKAATHDSHDD